MCIIYRQRQGCLYLKQEKDKDIKMEEKNTTIETVFVKQFEADVHTAYQQMGTKLRCTVRNKTNVVGSVTTFQKVGKGTAATKSRHGIVPVMNLNHEPIDCVLHDYYAGDWVDALDELKTNADERRIVASAGAYALGRKTDELILDALETSNNVVKSGKNIKETILAMISFLNEHEVPDDGRRFCIINVKQWNELLELGINESAVIDGSTAIKWLGVNFILHHGADAMYMYHQSAVGHACGQEVKTDISWHGERAAHFICNSMSQGACIIDQDGVVKTNKETKGK